MTSKPTFKGLAPYSGVVNLLIAPHAKLKMLQLCLALHKLFGTVRTVVKEVVPPSQVQQNYQERKADVTS